MKKKIRLSGNRTVIGIICIVLALAITFGVAPLINKFTDQKVDVIRVKQNVKQGQAISADDIELARVGAYNLPSGVIKDGYAVLGKYATTDLYAGDFIFASKLTTENKSADSVLSSLTGEKVAISVPVSSFANGLSGKLKNGDIVSVIINNPETRTSFIPAELKYIRVITTTTSGGVDKDENFDGGQPASITLLVTPEQAEFLASYDKMHFALVFRGDAATADEYVRVQDEYLESAGRRNG